MFHDFLCVMIFWYLMLLNAPSLTALFQPGDFQAGEIWLRRRAHGEGKKVTEKGRWAEPWEGIRSRAG